MENENAKLEFVKVARGSSKPIDMLLWYAYANGLSFEDALKVYINMKNAMVYKEALKSGQVHRSTDSERIENSENISSDYFVCPVSGDPS